MLLRTIIIALALLAGCATTVEPVVLVTPWPEIDDPVAVQGLVCMGCRHGECPDICE